MGNNLDAISNRVFVQIIETSKSLEEARARLSLKAGKSIRRISVRNMAAHFRRSGVKLKVLI